MAAHSSEETAFAACEARMTRFGVAEQLSMTPSAPTEQSATTEPTEQSTTLEQSVPIAPIAPRKRAASKRKEDAAEGVQASERMRAAEEAAQVAQASKPTSKRLACAAQTGDHRSPLQEPTQGEQESESPRIADEAEILRFLTEVLRGNVGDAQLKERFKAAELLGARSGLFERASGGAESGVTIVDDVSAKGGMP